MVPRPQTLPSPPTPAFTGTTLDRASELRASSSELDGLIADPTARAIYCREDEVLLASGGEGLLRTPLPEPSATRRGPDGQGSEPMLLGLEHGRPLFGVEVGRLQEDSAAELTAGGRWASLREAGGLLSPPEAGLGAYLVALTAWHRHHRFCPNCGGATDVVQGGTTRRCPRCERSHFPRTDPVVIMLVEHDGRLLLGRRPNWPAGRYSLLAGFVAAGESPEAAVVREVLEESGIQTERPRYVSSQPWPFPGSLMLGFIASSPGGEPYCADGELQDVRWFDRDEVQTAVADQPGWSEGVQEGDAKLLLPPGVAIARTLIEWWLATPDRPE